MGREVLKNWTIGEYGEIVAGDGKPVAFVAASRMDRDDVEGFSGDASAIGRLVAAAPDLLAALIAVTDELERIAMPEDEVGKVLHSSRATIAKAEGCGT